MLGVHDLPPPPDGRQGWPWTVGGAESTPDREWPRISIVTPSFNQGEFLEETIRSVLLQGYANLEYIVMDGASTDASVAIIQKYATWLTHWESQKDRGQSHALNKGFALATGDLFGWLNADDLFEPGALRRIMSLRIERPDAVAWVGACMEMDRKGLETREIMPRVGDREAFGDWAFGALFYQPACLFDAQAYREEGGVREDLHYVMDLDLWLRLLKRGPFVTTPSRIARARVYPEAKTQRDHPAVEAETIATCINNGLAEVARRRLVRYGAREVRRHQVRTQRLDARVSPLDEAPSIGKQTGVLVRGWQRLKRQWRRQGEQRAE